MNYKSIFEELDCIDESNTFRILGHLQDDSSCAIISPYRGEYSEEENRKRMVNLKSDTRKMGYGFIEFISRWAEGGEEFDERSILIPGITNKEAFELGKKYEQSSIIYKDDSGCFEVCTNPFEGHSRGDVVRKFLNTGEHILNIEQARDIISKKEGGAVPLPIKGGKPFHLGEIKEMFEVEQPRPSYFQTEERLTKIY